MDENETAHDPQAETGTGMLQVKIGVDADLVEVIPAAEVEAEQPQAGRSFTAMGPITFTDALVVPPGIVIDLGSEAERPT